MKFLTLILVMFVAFNVAGGEKIFTQFGTIGSEAKINLEQKESVDLSIGVLNIIDGEVQIKSVGTDDFVSANNNVKLFAGDLIKTESDSKSMVEYDDNSYLMLKENTFIQIKTAGISVRNGRVWVSVMKRNGKFEAETPAFVAGVRGTDFEVSVGPAAHKASLSLCDGIVDIKTETENSQLVGGQMAMVNKEKNVINVFEFDPETTYMDWGIKVNYNDENLSAIEIQRKIDALEPLLHLPRPEKETEEIRSRVLRLYQLKNKAE